MDRKVRGASDWSGCRIRDAEEAMGADERAPMRMPIPWVEEAGSPL